MHPDERSRGVGGRGVVDEGILKQLSMGLMNRTKCGGRQLSFEDNLYRDLLMTEEFLVAGFH